VRIENVGRFQQQFATDGRRGATPGRKYSGCRFDGALRIFSLPGGCCGGRLAVEWIRLLVGTFRGCVRPFSVDEELMLRDGLLVGLPVQGASAR